MPYTITWQAGTDPNTIDVKAVVSSAKHLQQHAPHAVFSPVVDFANLAAVGGLSGSHRHPKDAEARIVSHVISGRDVHWRLEVEGVALNSLHNIEGSLSYFDCAIAELETVSVIAPSAMISERDQAPQRHFVPLPFQLVDDRQDYGNLQIEIAFGKTLSPEVVERVEVEAFGMWLCAASAGCFCNDAFPPETCKLYLGEQLGAAGSLTLQLEEMILPEPAAVDSLLNALNWAHHHIAPISRVELYD